MAEPPHLLSIDQLDSPQLRQLFDAAAYYENALKTGQPLKVRQGKILSTLFFEASTRTRYSFTAAMLRLGGQLFNFSRNQSRTEWGEPLPDTARVMNGFADVVVLRHGKLDAIDEYVPFAEIPVINGGIGGEQFGAEHPTQAILDLYTIHKELGQIENRKVLMIGNLNLRVSRTLMKAFGKFPGLELYLVAPDDCWMKPEAEQIYRDRGIPFQRVQAVEEVLDQVDVIYQNGYKESREVPVPESIRLTRDKLRNIRKEAIILHPFPREKELAQDVDDLPQAKYFDQAKNAVPVRMAVLAQLFSS